MPTTKARTTWKKPSYTADPLYANSLDIDVKTGFPADYTSLCAAYRKLALDSAAKHGIPAQDREDAAQEVDLRFFLRDGLSWYDSKKEFNMPNGTTRTAKFGSMYNSWLFLSMLAERDKYLKQATRFMPVADIIPTELSPDIAEEVEERDAAERWIVQASQALLDEGYENLIPVLRVCVSAAALNKTVTRADVVEATGCSLHLASPLLKQLREVLAMIGMGADTLGRE